MPLPENIDERLKLKQEGLYDILAGFFSGGTYNNIFLGLFSELNGNLKKGNESFEQLNQNIAEANKSFESLNKGLMKMDESITKLDANIVAANESSERLSTALRRITLWGTIIAAISLFVAIASVGLDYYKTFSANPSSVENVRNAAPSMNDPKI